MGSRAFLLLPVPKSITTVVVYTTALFIIYSTFKSDRIWTRIETSRVSKPSDGRKRSAVIWKQRIIITR